MREKPTHWCMGYSLDMELAFADGRYLPRKAALILYPEYFDEEGNPIKDILPLGKPKLKKSTFDIFKRCKNELR